MVSAIKMGRQWVIETAEDYNKAIETLEENKFCAMMSDDFYWYRKELNEYNRQWADVTAQAKAKGII